MHMGLRRIGFISAYNGGITELQVQLNAKYIHRIVILNLTHISQCIGNNKDVKGNTTNRIIKVEILARRTISVFTEESIFYHSDT